MDRRSCGYYIVNDYYLSLQVCSNNQAPFTVVFPFLSIECIGYIAILVLE